MRLFDRPGRSVVYSSNAIIATSQPLATATGLDILKKGGNAMDAAIAASAVLSVIEPTDTGIGGDCFALYSQKGLNNPIAFNGSGKSPSLLTLDKLNELKINEINSSSPHSITIPGAIDAWCQLHSNYCNLDFEELLKPAINYSENGYIVHERLSDTWARNINRLSMFGDSQKTFLKNGLPPSPGQKATNINLSKTLKIIAKKGSKGFYEGEIANNIVKFLNSLGGLHSLEDFYQTKGDFVDPISSKYHGKKIFQLPPNTQGIITLIMMRILENFNLNKYNHNSTSRTHLLIEAAKIAYSLRDKLLGDSKSSSRILEILNNSKIIKKLAQSIDLKKVNKKLPSIPSLGSNTIYLTVVDKDLNVVSFINSIYDSFGSGIVPSKTGVLLQNRGKSFNLNLNHPNCIGPSKRPMHTIIPGMVSKQDRILLSYGVMGGDYQPMGHVHFLSNILDHDLNIQESLDSPRFMAFNNHVEVEKSMSNKMINSLRNLGHNISYSETPLGGGQAISINWQEGVLSAGSDPRKDGCALGY